MNRNFVPTSKRRRLQFVTPMLWILGVVSCVVSFLIIYNHVQNWGQ